MPAKQRLTLSTVGAPDLLDISSHAPEAQLSAAASVTGGTPPASRHPPRVDLEPTVHLVAAAQDAEPVDSSDLLKGAPRRRSLSLDVDLHAQLSDTAASAGVGLSTLVVALLERGLGSIDDVAPIVVAERVRRIGADDQRIRIQMPVPGRLATRLEEAVAEARRRSPRSTAADLANGILADELPAPKVAGRIVDNYRRRMEQVGLVAPPS